MKVEISCLEGTKELLLAYGVKVLLAEAGVGVEVDAKFGGGHA